MKYVVGLFVVVLVVSCATSAPPSPKQGAFSFKEVEATAGPALVAPTWVTANDGVKLAVYAYRAERAVASLVFLHGGGAYSGASYPVLAAGLAKNWGVNTYLVDLRGHGNSQGARGDSPSAEQLYRDLRLVIGEVLNDNPALPLVLGGHSSGAGLILNYLTWKPDSRLTGYVFVSPYWGYQSGTDKVAGRGAGEKPRFSQVDVRPFVLNSLTFGLLGGHAYAVEFNYPDAVLKNQPLLVPAITVNVALASTPARPAQQFTKLDHPFALLIGSDDELLDPAKVLAYAELPGAAVRAASQAHLVPGANHLSVLLQAEALVGPAVYSLVR